MKGGRICRRATRIPNLLRFALLGLALSRDFWKVVGKRRRYRRNKGCCPYSRKGFRHGKPCTPLPSVVTVFHYNQPSLTPAPLLYRDKIGVLHHKRLMGRLWYIEQQNVVILQEKLVGFESLKKLE